MFHAVTDLILLVCVNRKESELFTQLAGGQSPKVNIFMMAGI